MTADDTEYEEGRPHTGLAMRVVAVLLVLLLVGPTVVFIWVSQTSSGQAARIDVVIDNPTDQAYIVEADETVVDPPLGNSAVPNDAFLAAPHSWSMLPRDKSWDSVSLYTADCSPLGQDFFTVEGPQAQFTVTATGLKNGLPKGAVRPPADSIQIAQAARSCLQTASNQ